MIEINSAANVLACCNYIVAQLFVKVVNILIFLCDNQFLSVDISNRVSFFDHHFLADTIFLPSFLSLLKLFDDRYDVRLGCNQNPPRFPISF
jgi:hypothetical protein